ncbi:DnaJ domain-containing protein [Clostridium sp. BJN0001]|uniref:J domain-containing protein n=1 Tax=Clostridium sp. BJN0001 TaxID=2930219 RepID=UPI001FD0C7AB|nr:DnaJ domain-containing protein [Clostridium sp. BJN0001]
MNPYEILGVKENSTQDEIKKAYRKLIKQYHPDKYVDNPLKDLAEQKMREINEAYDMLTKNKGQSYNNNNTSSSYSNSSYSGSSYGNNETASFASVRNYIQMRNLDAALNELNSISYKSAEWHFLYGVIMANKGWYDSAFDHLNTAVGMDPNNYEYRQTLNSLNRRSNAYQNPYRTVNTNRQDACDCCINLWCLDSICECMGGDLVPCM